MGEFIKFLNRLKTSVHSGYYFKVKFDNQKNRDLFICELLHGFGLKTMTLSTIFQRSPINYSETNNQENSNKNYDEKDKKNSALVSHAKSSQLSQN